MALRTFTFNLSDIEFILQQLQFRPLFSKDSSGVVTAVINWDGTTAIYDSSGNLIFDPTLGVGHVVTAGEAAANILAYGTSYNSYTDISGIRDVTGDFNNLLPGQQTWGSAGVAFTRQTNADFGNYLHQVLSAVVTAETKSNTLVSDGSVTVNTYTIPGPIPITVTYDTFTRSITATTTVSQDGHHLQVSSNVVTGVLTTDLMVTDASGTHVVPGTHTSVALAPTTYLSGGELDPTYHAGLTALIAAAETTGTTTGLDMASYNPGKSVVDYTPRMISETITTNGHVTYDSHGHYLSGDGIVLMHDGFGNVVYYTGQSSDTLKAYQYDSSKTIDTRGLVYGAAIVDTTVPLLDGQPDGSGGVTANGDANLYSGAGYGELALTGQHDKQNTDANNATGFGNHEYFYGNVASIGGNAPNNQFMMLFGQFFDHGLDFIGKAATDAAGHTVTITIPLAVNDPLYGVIGNDGKPTTSITVTRATVDNTWLKDTAGNVLDGRDLAHSIVDGSNAAVLDVNGNPLSRAGMDGLWGTADDIASLGGATGNSTVGEVLAPQNPTYINHTSPYIDQSQTYGSVSDVTQILRQWVQDPNHPGHYVAGARLFDGHQSVAWTDAFGHSTTQTLPTLNELRDEISGTDRTALTWEDVSSDLRHRDAQGHVGYYDANGVEVAYLDSATVDGSGNVIDGVAHWVDTNNTNPVDLTGLITHSSTEPLLLDMNPHVDGAHLSSNLAQDAIATLNASLQGIGGPGVNGHFYVDGTGVLTLDLSAISTYLPPGVPAVSTGLSALGLWVDFSNFSILENSQLGGPLTAAVHAAVGEILMDSVGDHYIAGDGRTNENFGLTAIHQIWHEEHGFQVANLEATIASLDGQATAADALNGTSLDPGHKTLHNWEVAVTNLSAPITDSLVQVVGDHLEATGGVLARDTDGNFYVASGNQAADSADTGHAFAGYVMVDNTAQATFDGSGNITNGLTAAGNYTDANGYLSWNQDAVFNGAKMTVEMEYQHVAVDQFSRAVTPNIQEFGGVSTARNAAISLEYGEGAYRFGHSTLRETLDTMDPTQGVTGKIMSYALEEAFLNPAKFATIGAGAVVQGAARQLMNEVDQFVTPSLNEGLLAQPLDLATINIARGRDIGLPTLNEFKAKAGVGQVYASWEAFQQNMAHPERVSDFIAAYSFDGDIAKAQTIVDLASLQAGQQLSASEQAVATANGWDQTFAFNFMNNINGADAADGVNHIDLWIGGLAEVHVAGGILGETFDAIFVNQIENLMDGDRFYYLQRLINTDFGNEIQNEQFKDIVERNTGTQNLNGNIFAYADQYYDQGRAAKVATGDLTDPTKAGDLYAGSKSDGSWIKVFDGATHKWVDGTSPTSFTSDTPPADASGMPIYDLWGQEVTDLFNAAHTKVFDRATMRWTDPSYADGSQPLYYDANTDANGFASASPASYVYLGADQHKYGALLTAHSADTAVVSYDVNGAASAQNDIVAPPGTQVGLGIYSEDFASTALNGTVGAHHVTLTLGDDTNSNGVLSFVQNYIYDARPDGTTTNLDGSIDSGANSAEVVVGTQYADFIQLGIGDDTGYGGAGNDIIYGGNANAGHNTIYGGDGNDYLVGGDAPDLIDGGNGDDWIFGQSSGSSVNGQDQIIGGAGNDHIYDGIGISKMFGGTGDDYLYGGQDTDPSMFGGDGNDYLNGGSGSDVISGGRGDDILDGGPGVDQLFGDQGDDILRPGDIADVNGNGGGGDVLDGATGTAVDDGFDFADYSQQTTTNGLVGDLANQAAVGQLPKDKTPLPPGVAVATNTGDVWFEMEGIIGTKSADHLYGDSPADSSATPVSLGNNWLVGGSGNDVIDGRGGNDVIVGGSVRLDTLIGTYYSASNPSDAYHAADDYSVNAEGASHRIYADAILQHNGLLDAATAASGVTFDKHFTALLQSRAYKDYSFGDGGTDGSLNVAAYTGSLSDYTFQTVSFTSANAGNVQALLIHDTRAADPTGAANDGTDLLVGIQVLEFNYDETTGTGTLVQIAAPTITSSATLSLDENTTAVGTVTTAALLNDEVTYSIVAPQGAVGLDANLFQIDPTTGALAFKAAPNFELPAAAGGGNTYDVVVQATNAIGVSSTQDITVTVNNLNEPTVGGTAMPTLSQVGGGLTLTDSAISDGDLVTLGNPLGAATTASYDWQSSVDGGLSWQHIAGAPPTASYALSSAPPPANSQVRVVASYTDAFGTETVTSAAITLTPTFQSSAAVSSAENTTAVETVVASLTGVTDTFTYSIVGGTDQGTFSITSGGALSFVSAPNFELPTAAGGGNTYDVIVQATDQYGLSATQDVSVAVTNVQESPAPTVGAPTLSVSGGALVFADPVITDGDLVTPTNLTGAVSVANTSYAWQSFDGTGWSSISGASSTATFTPSAAFLASGAQQVRAVASVTDAFGTHTVTSAAFALAPLTPSITTGATFSVAENTTAVSPVAALDSAAVQALFPVDSFSYSVVGGADQAKFSIVASTGALSFLGAPDFEAHAGSSNFGNTYDVIVRATDQLGLSTTQDIKVTVTNVNEASSGGALLIPGAVGPVTTSVALTDSPITDPDLVTGANPTGAVTAAYQWYSSSTGGVTWTAIGGATSATFTPSGTLTTTPTPVHVVATYSDVFGSNTVTSQAAEVGSTLNNTLLGTAAGDLLIGLGGNDIYVVNNAGDVVIEAVGAGTDTVQTTLATYTLAANVETLTYLSTTYGGVAADASRNYTWTGNTGANTLTGGSGNDTLDGSGGVDILNGGLGTDTAVFGATLGSAAFSLSGPSLVVAVAGETATLSSVENAQFTDGTFHLVIGTAANDALVGTAAADLFLGFAGTDAASYAASTTGVTASLANPAANTGVAAGDVYNSIENLTGSSTAANSLTGDTNANTLTGGSANDTLNGGGGVDTLNGGLGTDTAVFAAALGSATFSLPGANLVVAVAGETATLIGVENAQFSDGTFHLVIGTTAANVLTATAAADLFLGFAGTDTVTYATSTTALTASLTNPALNAGAAAGDVFNSIENLTGSSTAANTLTGDANANTLTGGAANDIFKATVGDGNDSYVGGGGVDTYDLSATSANATINLNFATQALSHNTGVAVIGASTATSVDTGTDTLNSIENVIGGSGDDVFVASASQNTFAGGAGNDIFVFATSAIAGNGSSTRDIITDFAQGNDRIDLHYFDANTGVTGNQAFIFDGEEAALGSVARGHLAYHYETIGGVAHTMIDGNTANVSNVANFQIDLIGHIALTASDFYLT